MSGKFSLKSGSAHGHPRLKFGVDKTVAKAKAFTLKKESAKKAKPTVYHNAGAGKTLKMFDVKSGDLKGQTSMFDHAPKTRATGRHTPARIAKARALVARRRGR